MRQSIGRTSANLVLAGAALAVVAAFVLPTLAMLRLNRVVSGHRRVSLQAVTALSLVWVLCWGLGAQLVSGANIASTSAADLAVTGFDLNGATGTDLAGNGDVASEFGYADARGSRDPEADRRSVGADGRGDTKSRSRPDRRFCLAGRLNARRRIRARPNRGLAP